MVMTATSLGRNGVQDWLIQRISAVVLLLYVLFLTVYIAQADELTFIQWRGLFGQTWMRVFTLAALVSLLAHAWIGLWTITTDYLTRMALGAAAAPIRLFAQLLILLVLICYFAWCVQILWSI